MNTFHSITPHKYIASKIFRRSDCASKLKEQKVPLAIDVTPGFCTCQFLGLISMAHGQRQDDADTRLLVASMYLTAEKVALGHRPELTQIYSFWR